MIQYIIDKYESSEFLERISQHINTEDAIDMVLSFDPDLVFKEFSDEYKEANDQLELPF